MASGWVAARPLSVVWKHEHGDWFCLFEQFDITGTGDSERDAYRDALGLLVAYLSTYFHEGQPLRAALRPIPLRLKLEIRRDVIVGSVLRRVLHRPGDHESKVVILPEQVASGYC